MIAVKIILSIALIAFLVYQTVTLVQAIKKKIASKKDATVKDKNSDKGV
mgnify:CR=1 FL=1